MNRRTFIKSGALFVPMIFVPKLIRAQSLDDAAQAALIMQRRRRSGGGGGGGGSWTLLDSTVKASTDGNGFTTTAINATGATFIGVVVASYSAYPAPTSSPSNTFATALQVDSLDGSPSRRLAMYYCASPSVSGSFTVSIPGTGNYSVVVVYAFSGGDGGALDQTNHNILGSGANYSTGSITPSNSSKLILTGFEFKSGTTATINSGFMTPLKAGSGSFSVGGAASYLIPGNANPVNPTWAMGSADFGAALIASF